jgi:hypothetical protein
VQPAAGSDLHACRGAGCNQRRENRAVPSRPGDLPDHQNVRTTGRDGFHDLRPPGPGLALGEPAGADPIIAVAADNRPMLPLRPSPQLGELVVNGLTLAAIEAHSAVKHSAAVGVGRLHVGSLDLATVNTNASTATITLRSLSSPSLRRWIGAATDTMK